MPDEKGWLSEEEMKTAKKPDLELIMVKNPAAKLGYDLLACRGEGKGCKRNKFREAKAGCEDCVLADPKETMGELQARLKKGDA